MLGMGIVNIHASDTTAYNMTRTTEQNFKDMLIARIQSARVPREWPKYKPSLTPQQKFIEANTVLNICPQLPNSEQFDKSDYCSFLAKRYKIEALEAGCPEAITDMVSHLYINVVSLKSRPNLTDADLYEITQHVHTYVKDPEMLKVCTKNLSDVRSALFKQ